MQGNRERIATPPQLGIGVVMVRRPRSQLGAAAEEMPGGRPRAITSRCQNSVLGCAAGLQPASGSGTLRTSPGTGPARARGCVTPVAVWVH